ncbi:PaaI family thioesterase [Rhodococcus maanshanensis]|uniref:Acyl-coenzyme A thioesterase THEM4 n=1 Tax=Rhodococcus maanshanensis TaxID=183556 RepID=A0A1H7JLL5_9NOCA|nr:PaaI family thioesterase [Rhodococcus maanshanensis]SEK75284.1 Acyl-coenzyme A thioesterase PaaI, contains HGG motif [Rhodococcus maanshanensis]
MSEQVERGRGRGDVDDYEQHGGFPVYRAAEDNGGPDFGRLVEALRTIQDLGVSTAPPADVVRQAAEQAEALVALLEPHRVPEGQQPAGRSMGLPGRGSLLMMPWTIEKFDETGVRSTGEFRRFHMGGNGAAHGGTLPLLFDDLFGMVTHAYGRPISRTGYLHVNYRKITPINTQLTVEGQVDRVEGRKTFVSARLVDAEGTLLADCEALMVVLLPGQP